MRKISFGAILLLLVLAITHRQLTHRQLTHRQLTHRQLTPREHSFALAADAKWTSAREINDLKVDKKGALWAATGGGVLRLQNGAWMKCSDGLPSNDVNGLRVQGDEIFAFTARDTALWQNGQWKQANQALFCVPQNVLWQGKKIYVLQNSLKMGSGTNARIIPLPKASGTHMSAILSRSGVLRAAMFGDGIWEWKESIAGED